MISFREKGKPNLEERPAALPFYSVDSRDQAERLIELLCFRDEKGLWRFQHFAGRLEAMKTLAEIFDFYHQWLWPPPS